LVLWLAFTTGAVTAMHFGWQDRFDPRTWARIEDCVVALLLFTGLFPFATTMALIWKTKEVIFDGVFGTRR